MSFTRPGSGSLAELAAQFERDRNADALLEARTAAVDLQVQACFDELLRNRAQGAVAIAAVGGYGRRELFPCSDVDLLILSESEDGLLNLKIPLPPFLSRLWDIGLRVSHSTRTVAECVRYQPDNLELHISLLDARFVAGDSGLFAQLTKRLPELVGKHSAAMVSRLVEAGRQRHAKYNDTPYHLEPNVKEAPGAIRDLHLLRWLSQLQPNGDFLRESVTDLAMQTARRRLFDLRCFLHLQAGRDANLLTFELQDEAARALAETVMAPEEFMRHYLNGAKLIFQRALRALEFAGEAQETSLLKQLRERKSRWSTRDFQVQHGRVNVPKLASFMPVPDEMLRLFAFAGQHGLQLSWETQWRIRQEIETVEQGFEQSAPGWKLWAELLSTPYAALAIGEMQETGVLAAAIPAWRAIDSLVVRDFYHRYTVDEHTLVALQELDSLQRKRSSKGVRSTDEVTRFENLVHEEGVRPELRLAILLHDIGKGTTPGDHLRGSLQVAAEVLARMGAPQPVREAVLFLIQHHLHLSTIMNGRDLEDPATARLLTAEVPTVEDLRRLTLLTFADISAVNPTAMSPWRMEQLWRAYTLGSEQLTRELASDRIHDRQRQANNGMPDRLIQFLDGFPKRYLRTHTREQIDRHLQLAGESRRSGVAVEITAEAGAYLMTVLTHDRSGLFASLCGVLASFGMNIVKGEASSNSGGCVLDLIRFTDPNETLALNPEEMVRLKDTVKSVVNGSAEVSELLKRRRPAARPTSEAVIAPTVRFNNSASDGATLIDFIGEDRPGLLHDLAAAISGAGCNIEVVMIDTEAHKAIDVFYVTDNGRKLDGAKQEQLRADLLQAAEGQTALGGASSRV